jgi:integrase/uncharacterized protein (DUF433 family)
MPKKVTPLTDTRISKSKPKNKEYTLSDGNGLQLCIKPTGSKVWQMVYTSPLTGKRRKHVLGHYPSLSLKDARTIRAKYHEAIAKGEDPIEMLQEQRRDGKMNEEAQFHNVLYSWLDTLGTSESTAKKRKRAFERDLFPFFCEYDREHRLVRCKKIGDISHTELVHALDEKAKSAEETARRLLSDCRNLWQYAYERGYVEELVTAKIGKSAFSKKKPKHYAKITDEKTLAELLKKIDGYHGDRITRLMLKFVAIIPLRAGNLTSLKWEMVDFDKELLVIPRNQMKDKDPNLSDFVVPLPRQAIKILREVHHLTGWGEWVFTGKKNMHNHINEETGNKALRILGFNDEKRGRKQTLHSFRGTFRSLVDTHQEEHNASYETKEKILDHTVGSKTERAYTHQANYVPQMRKLLQWWADWLENLSGDKNA